jgi:hypothetical protein
MNSSKRLYILTQVGIGETTETRKFRAQEDRTRSRLSRENDLQLIYTHTTCVRERANRSSDKPNPRFP